jgi:uncharacterized membrane protein
VDHLLLKSLHVLGVVMFVGNIFATAMWKVRADKTRDAKVMAFAQMLVTRTDFIFTGVGAVLVLVTGVLMLDSYEGPMSVWWIRRGLEFFGLSAVVWGAVLVPIQVKQAKMAKVFAESGDVPDEYYKLGKRWIMIGGMATLLLIANVIIMVYKPT